MVSLSVAYAAVDQGCPQPLTPRYKAQPVQFLHRSSAQFLHGFSIQLSKSFHAYSYKSDRQQLQPKFLKGSLAQSLQGSSIRSLKSPHAYSYTIIQANKQVSSPRSLWPLASMTLCLTDPSALLVFVHHVGPAHARHVCRIAHPHGQLLFVRPFLLPLSGLQHGVHLAQITLLEDSRGQPV